MERLVAEAGSLTGAEHLGFALTVGARLCHDLAGTLGALAGALEMAAEGGDPEALDLALSCARELTAKLRLLRAAWSEDAEIPDPALLTAGLPGAERLSVDLSHLSPEAGGPMRRLVVNLMLLGAASLPRGGTILIRGDQDAVSMEIAGARAAWPDTLHQCLASADGLLATCTSPREVGIAVTCLLADRLGLRIILRTATALAVAKG